MSQRYLRLDFEALLASKHWQSLDAAHRGLAIHQLLIQAQQGKVPESWKRVASLRTVGVPGTAQPKEHRDSPFKPFYLAWEEAWAVKKTDPFVWSVKGRASMRTVYARCQGDVETWKRKVQRYFELGEWYVSRASPEMVVSRWNDLAAGVTVGIKKTLSETDRQILEERKKFEESKAKRASPEEWAALRAKISGTRPP